MIKIQFLENVCGTRKTVKEATSLQNPSNQSMKKKKLLVEKKVFLI